LESGYESYLEVRKMYLVARGILTNRAASHYEHINMTYEPVDVSHGWISNASTEGSDC
jgi:hypothetical protein